MTSAGYSDIFVSKIDNLGNFVWAKRMGGSNFDFGTCIEVDSADNVYTTGRFYGMVDFDPGAGIFIIIAAGYDDVFVSKLDSAGNFVWAKHMGGTGFDNGSGIIVDSAGSVYTTGEFSGTADFDPGAGTFNLISDGSRDIFVSKLDSTGDFVWAKAMGGWSVYEHTYGIAVDSTGNVYTTGYFQNTVDFDPGAGIFNLTWRGNDDIFVSKWTVPETSDGLRA